MTTRYERLAVRSRRCELVAALAAVVFTVLACRFAPGPHADATALAAGRVGGDRTAGTGDGGSRAAEGAPGALPRSAPARVTVRGTGVDAEVVTSREPGREGFPVAPPEDPMRVAWAANGPAPGEDGVAVLVGDLDSERGPAAFAGLGGLRPGAHIRVGRADARAARFEVFAVQRYGMGGPPGNLAHAEGGSGPRLRLVGVGGAWTAPVTDDTTVVAFARGL